MLSKRLKKITAQEDQGNDDDTQDAKALIMKEFYKIIFKEWAEDARKKGLLWISEPHHSCSTGSIDSKCVIDNPRAEVFRVAPTDGSNKAKYHVCCREYCKDTGDESYLWDHCRNKIACIIDNVYICRRTGKFHVCDGDCKEERTQNMDREMVCCMSGKPMGPELQASFGDGIEIKKDNNHSKDEPAQSKAKKNSTYEACKTVVWAILFSPEREAHNAKQKKVAEKYAQQEVKKYIKECNKNCEVKVIPTMKAIWKRSWKKKYTTKEIVIESQEDKEALTHYYTSICYGFYQKCIEECKNTGMVFPKVSLHEFTIATLYLMKSGLKSEGDGITIIPKDSFIYSVLPEPGALSEIYTTKINFTYTKTTIRSLLNSMLDRDNALAYSLAIRPSGNIADFYANGAENAHQPNPGEHKTNSTYEKKVEISVQPRKRRKYIGSENQPKKRGRK